MKKIWIDMTNSPHVLFFKPIIKSLFNCEITITTREHSQTIELLDLFRLNYKIIGKHAGRSKIKKGLSFVGRMVELYKYMKNKECEIVVVHQSPYAMFPAYLLGIKKRIYIFDNETARIQNMIGMTFATDILAPKYLTLQRIFTKKIKKYGSLKESIYLNSAEIGSKQDIGLKKDYILIRPEPWTAAYYNSIDGDRLISLIKKMSKDPIAKKYSIVVIPRDKAQKEIYKKEVGNLVIIPEKALDGPTLVKNASLLIGAGGTMNREAVVLGTSVISIYSGHLLEVDKYLISKRFMNHKINVSLKDVKRVLNENKLKRDFLKEGILAQKQIVEEILR